jgi:hypothetical protein
MDKNKEEIDEMDEEEGEGKHGGYDIIDVTPKSLKNGNVDATKSRK